MLELTGYIRVPKSDLEAVLNELPNHISLTLAETGCLAFSVTQRAFEPLVFDVAERFTNRTSFEYHQARVKTSTWGHITKQVERYYQVQEVPDA